MAARKTLTPEQRAYKILKNGEPTGAGSIIVKIGKVAQTIKSDQFAVSTIIEQLNARRSGTSPLLG